MKLSTKIALLVTSIFYSATPDLTFSDLYNHFCVHFCLYLPEALFYTAKTEGNCDSKEQVGFLFEVYRQFHSKVIITSIT